MKKLIKKVVFILKNKKAEGYVDSSVKILLAVILGAALIGGLYVLLSNTVLPSLTTAITNLFTQATTEIGEIGG